MWVQHSRHGGRDDWDQDHQRDADRNEAAHYTKAARPLWLDAHGLFGARKARILHGGHNATDEQNLEWYDTNEIAEPRRDAVVQIAQEVEPQSSSEDSKGSQDPRITPSQGDHDSGDQHERNRGCERADVVHLQQESAVKGGLEVDLS